MLRLTNYGHRYIVHRLKEQRPYDLPPEQHELAVILYSALVEEQQTPIYRN